MDYLTLPADTENPCKRRQQQHWSQAKSHVADDIKAWLSAAAYHKTSTIIVVDDKGQIGDERVINQRSNFSVRYWYYLRLASYTVLNDRSTMCSFSC